MLCACLLALVAGLTVVVSSCKAKSGLATVDTEPQIDTVIYVELPVPGPDDTLFLRYSIRNTNPDSLRRLLYRPCEGNLSIVYERFAAVRSALPLSVTDQQYLDTLTEIYTRRIARNDQQLKRLRPMVYEGLQRTVRERSGESTDTLSPNHAYYHIRRVLNEQSTFHEDDVDALYYSLVVDAFLVDTPIAGYLAYSLADRINSPFNPMMYDDCGTLESYTSSVLPQVLIDRWAIMRPIRYRKK